MKAALYWWSQLDVSEQNMIILLFNLETAVCQMTEPKILQLYELTKSLNKIIHLTSHRTLI